MTIWEAMNQWINLYKNEEMRLWAKTIVIAKFEEQLLNGEQYLKQKSLNEPKIIAPFWCTNNILAYYIKAME